MATETGTLGTCRPLQNCTSSYDANGNMLTRGNQAFTWDIDDRVTCESIGGVNVIFTQTGARCQLNEYDP